MKFNLSNQDGATTLALFASDGYSKVLASTHPQFVEVLTYITTTPEGQHDDEYVKGLADPTVGIAKQMQEITDRVTFDLHHVYFDGQKVNNTLSQHIADKMRAGDLDWKRLIRFMLNLDDNPSYQAQQAVYRWIEANGLTITPEGNFIGYKSVSQDGLSSSAGPNNYIDGVLYKEGGSTRVPHEIGTVISKKRAQVDDNTKLACSVGLHVGTKNYATGFARRLLTVEINPADVVSIPDGDLSYKIRVCRYKVLGLASDDQFASTAFDPKDAQPVAVVDNETMIADHALVVGRFDTVEEAEQYLTTLSWSSPEEAEKVQRGAYSIDAPEVEEDVTEEEFEPDANAGTEFAENNPITIQDVADADPEHVVIIHVGDDDPVDDVEEPEPSLSADLTLAENAAISAALKADLDNQHLGHKAVGRKWSEFTTESSVRRYRKANGITLKVAAKVKDAVS